MALTRYTLRDDQRDKVSDTRRKLRVSSRRPSRDRARARPQNDGACGDREGDPEPARPTSPRFLLEETPRGRQRRSETARRTRTAAGRPRRIDRDDDGCARRRETRGRREGDENAVRASKARRCAVVGDGDVRDGWGNVRREDRGGERRAVRGGTRTRTRVRTRARERRRVRRVDSRAGGGSGRTTWIRGTG